MIALDALLRTVQDQLLASQQFGDRVFWGEAPQGTASPYCVYIFTGGGDDNARAVKKTAAITLQITCFCQDDPDNGVVGSSDAFVGAEIIDFLFDDRGEQDAPAAAGLSALDATGHGWHITTVTAVGDVNTIERYENVQPIYQAGKEYQFIMEEV